MEKKKRESETEMTYAVLRTSACNPYSLAKVNVVTDCGNAAYKFISKIIVHLASIQNIMKRTTTSFEDPFFVPGIEWYTGTVLNLFLKVYSYI